MRFSVEEIVSATAGTLVLETASANCTANSLTWDSRDVAPGSLYVAIVGSRVDGHKFLADAARAGAVCMLVSARPAPSVLVELEALGAAVVLVADTQEAICALASAWRKQLNCNVIGITGSSGKTTTKNFVRGVLERAGSVCATLGNQNNELGLPATVLRASKASKFLVCEMGMRGAGQIASLCEIAKPTLGVITNVGTAHIDILGSERAIAHAKAELFAALPASGAAFVNVTGGFANELCEIAELEQRGVPIVAFDGSGQNPNALATFCVKTGASKAVWAEGVELQTNGCASFTLCASGFESNSATANKENTSSKQSVVKAKCTLALSGKHNVTNACAAAALGLYLGVPIKNVAQALESTSPESGREQVICTHSGISIIDGSYNANPASMAAALDVLASAKTSGKRIAVLGTMAELGSFAESAHAQIGSHVAALPIAALVCVGSEGKFIAQGAISAGFSKGAVTCVENAEEALKVLQGIAKKGDVVLVKASRALALEHIIEGLV